MLAPIILFVYNRPWHTEQTVEALKMNELVSKSDFFIFSDGSKAKNDENVEKVREYIKAVHGFKSVAIVEREKNLGLAESVIAGVTEIVNKCGKVIVLEDDLVTSKHFLRFMNEGLDIYENEEKVISIHGYMYPVEHKLPDTFFLKGTDCWGWATWRRGWDLFNPDGNKLLAKIEEQNLEKEFDFNGAYPYTRMLRSQIEGFNNSWAIRWYSSAFLEEKLTLYPGISLVDNIGNDNSGTHCGDIDEFKNTICDHKIKLVQIAIEESVEAKKFITEFFLYNNKNAIYKKIINFIKR